MAAVLSLDKKTSDVCPFIKVTGRVNTCLESGPP
jgi:hypothetical protein